MAAYRKLINKPFIQYSTYFRVKILDFSEA